MSKSGCVDFGDLPAGSARSLPLKLVNRTHATVPIRLVISAVSQQHLSLFLEDAHVHHEDVAVAAGRFRI